MCGLWGKKTKKFSSNFRKGKKIRSNEKEKEQIHEYYEITFHSLKKSIRSLYDHTLIIFNIACNFSFVFDFFARKISKIRIQSNEDTRLLIEYRELIVLTEKNILYNLESLKKEVNGYLILNVYPKTKQKKLAQIKYEESDHYILSGCYIMPTTQSLYFTNKDNINGTLMDTTFNFMPNYLTSILMLSSFNLGIPMGFSFGPKENKALYEILFTILRLKTGIDISEIPTESDLGPALNGVCTDFGMINFYCIHHFLGSLKYKPFAYEIGLLVKSSSLKDLEQTKEVLTNKLKKIKDKKYLNKIKYLNNIGMSFDKNYRLYITNEIEWTKVSLLKRIPFKIPTTTNSLESTHGHLSKKMPRRNNSWMSMFRIIRSLSFKNQSLNQMYRQNFYFTKHITLEKVKSTSQREM